LNLSGYIPLATSWLPSSLISLVLIYDSRVAPPEDYFADLPSSLRNLNLQFPARLTDAHLAHLRHYNQLQTFTQDRVPEIEVQVTGESFKNLPRSLSMLVLPCQISRVLPEHYEQLPPNLRRVTLKSLERATHYTQALLDHLPPSLTFFNAPITLDASSTTEISTNAKRRKLSICGVG